MVVNTQHIILEEPVKSTVDKNEAQTLDDTLLFLRGIESIIVCDALEVYLYEPVRKDTHRLFLLVTKSAVLDEVYLLLEQL